MSYLIFITSLLVTQCLGQYLQTCYDPLGTVNLDLIPCNPDAPVSACCGSGYICDTVLDCIDAKTGVQYVPGCTDSSFADTACPWPLNATYTNDPSNPPFYQTLNITICADGTACDITKPSCCSAGSGIPVQSFYNTATVPSASTSYSAYYAAASYGGYSIPTGSDYFSAFTSQSAASPSLYGVRTIVSVDTLTVTNVNSYTNAGAPSPTFDLTSRAPAPITTNPPSLASKATTGPSSPTVSSQTKSGGSRAEYGASLAIGALVLSVARLLLG